MNHELSLPTRHADARLDSPRSRRRRRSSGDSHAHRHDRAGPPLAGRRRDVELADRRAAGRLAHPRRGVEDLRRRRHRVRRPARRVRRLAGGARPPGDRAGGHRAGRPRARTSRSPPRTRSSSPRSCARRFGLPLWRFGNSGTEATMDAVHLMRAATGRDIVIKVEGCYHGHHDSVEVSVLPEADEVGPADRPLRGAGQHRHPAGDRRPGRRRRLQRPRCRRPGAREHPGPGRRHDRRAGDDERRHHPARRRATSRASATCCTSTARCSPSTR